MKEESGGTYLKIKRHEILDIWFDGLQAGPIFQSLSDSCDRWLKTGLQHRVCQLHLVGFEGQLILSLHFDSR